MPSKFLVKQYAPDSFYHVFNRGVEKRNIFVEEQDYSYFLHLLKSYLGNEVKKDKNYRPRPNYYKRVDLVAFCLMPNHFHLLLFQKDRDAIATLMRSLGTAYSMYFNQKYNRVGKLFQDRYKASRVTDETYYQHITRYIHLNPLDIKQDYLSYDYSSLQYWLGSKSADWVKHQRVSLGFGEDSQKYLDFLKDYEEIHDDLALIKEQMKG